MARNRESTPQHNPYRPVWFIFFTILALIVIMAVSRAMAPDEIIPWRTDLAAAREEARAQNKPVLAYFTASWCGPCQRMKRTTWADKDVEQTLRSYVPVKIDIDEQREIASQYAHYAQTDAVPFYVLLNAEGEPVRSTDGAYPPQMFIQWLTTGHAVR